MEIRTLFRKRKQSVIPLVCVYATVLGIQACRGTATTSGVVSPRVEGGTAGTVPHHQRDLLTAAELSRRDTFRGGSLYDAVAALRPEFLSTRFETSGALSPAATVIVDGSVRGGPQSLRAIQVPFVREVRFVRGTDAAVLLGPEYRSGAILVTTNTR